ncbi:ankyrin repeat domain-containing protein [Lysobacter capsici]|uniref:ankyrin repeat domain-containing protein n=1 Tax=Lysobacter capsici TaxID=435897 RepID=UPI001C0040A5|nr:ankyrin repeat domain-containing protein [Lysobacter capsici]QWF18147.1 ankyrin repeat domain-containing protein [Lysobacter capsici]
MPVQVRKLCRRLKVPLPIPGIDPNYGPAPTPWKEAAEVMAAAVERIEDPELRERARDLAFPELHYAAIRGDVEVVEALLNAGLAPDMYPCTEDGDDEPPLAWLAQHREGRVDDTSLLAVAMLLLDRGAAIDEGTLPPLHYAAELEDEEMMALLLGADGEYGETRPT